jgi:hypothetical protein
MNAFITILKSHGFTRGFSDRWFDADALRSDFGQIVEVHANSATLDVGHGRSVTFKDDEAGISDFRNQIAH